MEVLIFVGIAVAIGLAIWGAWYFKKKRREELALVAKQLGLTYSQEDTFGMLSLPFDLLRRGDGRGTENVLWGTWQGLGISEFDYWFYDETTDSEGHRSRSYSHFSCAVTQVPLAGNHLTVSKENVFTRLADHMGFRDIEFELEEFNRSFQVKSEDRRFANDVIDQRMMQWLMNNAEGFSFEYDLGYVLCFSRRRRPAELVPLLGTLKGFHDQIPNVVYSLYGTGAPAPGPPQTFTG